MRRFLFILLLSLILAGNALAAPPPVENQIKAAYIYNFAKFIQWPDKSFADSKSPLIIGLLGDSDFKHELMSLSTKTVCKRPIEVVQFKTLDKIGSCHILYVSSLWKEDIAQVLKNLQGRGIVTVSTTKNFAKHGGTIQFLKKRQRLRFIINLKAAQNDAIKIDSQLLSLAVDVLR